MLVEEKEPALDEGSGMMWISWRTEQIRTNDDSVTWSAAQNIAAAEHVKDDQLEIEKSAKFTNKEL